jgi:S-adenosylmethionine synthetase
MIRPTTDPATAGHGVKTSHLGLIKIDGIIRPSDKGKPHLLYASCDRKQHMNGLVASESVCSGHPDKVCDRISDSIVDAALTLDPYARVAVETLVTENRIVLAGEVTCKAPLPYENIARDAIKKLGYTNPLFHFTDQSPISIYIHEQSHDIAVGVDDEGAGDQGMMYGYACTETPEYMPLPIAVAQALCKAIDTSREDRTIPYLRPDGKAEVTIRYENDTPVGLDRVVIAVPYDPTHTKEELFAALVTHVITPVLTRYNLAVPESKNITVNGTGVWEIGGPASDTGVTGRKIIVDTYGGFVKHGGGAFSGKDPTKVDRSGAYGCRYVAKNIVAAGLATRCEVRVAYVIGLRDPIAYEVDTFETNTVSQKEIDAFAKKTLSMRVSDILTVLELRKPIYEKTSSYGHFGRTDVSWEKIVK